MKRIVLAATLLAATLVLAGCGCWGAWHRCHLAATPSEGRR